ncbi:efflux RND transporter periplasmic adaptor subunit [Paraburkholderia sp. B3]|uniref:efflux RND transporter periplasmic adaptor subunit n=1 Tax=Paraburkholderia sp. B3 TaxID=3134791 RepID=UPI003981AD87
MDVLIHRNRRSLVAGLVALLWLTGTFGESARADRSGIDAGAAPTVVAREQTFSVRLTAYGQVEPTAIINVRTVDAGTLGDLHVLPGSIVAAGEVLARVSGPQMYSLMTQREGALQGAKARLDAATHALEIAREQLAIHLGTRQAVDTAISELAASRAAEQSAKAQLAETSELLAITAPVAGSVIAVQAADGEQTHAGQTLLTIEPRGPLWVRAKYYGANASMLYVGMVGRFAPVGGGAPVPVKIATIAPAVGADGGLQVGLGAIPEAHWISGQWGTVTLDGPSAPLVMVPTAALILDRGEWWVLVHTPKGDEPRRVVPGPARGWWTGIVSGLRPGEKIVARDAFLEYHRGIAQTYQPPD